MASLTPEFTPEMMNHVVSTYGDRIEAIAVTKWGGSATATVSGKDPEKYYASGNMVGVNPGWFIVNAGNFSLIDGRIFTEKESQADSYTIIVSDKLVNNLFDGDVSRALGSRLDLNYFSGESQLLLSYTIIGVYRYQGYGGMMDASSEKDISTELYVSYRNLVSLSEQPDQLRQERRIRNVIPDILCPLCRNGDAVHAVFLQGTLHVPEAVCLRFECSKCLRNAVCTGAERRGE